MRFWGSTLGVPKTRAENLGSDVVEVLDGKVDVTKVVS
jgi:hypothetical protein